MGLRRCTFVAGQTGHGHTAIGIGIQWTVALGAMHREAFRHLQRGGKGFFLRVGLVVFLKAWKNGPMEALKRLVVENTPFISL